MTDSLGRYCYNNLSAGTYIVKETNQSGWQQTLPISPGTYSITLASGQHKDSVNFGNKQLPVLGSTCGVKFNCFTNLKPGKYTDGEVDQTGWTQTAPASGSYSFNLTSG